MDDSLLSLLNHRILGSLTPFTLEINGLSPNILEMLTPKIWQMKMILTFLSRYTQPMDYVFIFKTETIIPKS